MEETHPPAQNLYHRSMQMRNKLALFFTIFIEIHLMVFNIQVNTTVFSEYTELNNSLNYLGIIRYYY